MVAALSAAWALACTEDPSVLSIQDEGTGELMEVVERYETEYGVRIKSDFDASDFGPVNTGRVLPYTPANDIDDIIQLLQYVEENAFSYFSKEFLNEYMPRTILLVDSLNVAFGYSDTYNTPSVEWSENRSIPGYVTDRYLVLGNASSRFDPNAEGLKEELISLVVERLLGNSDRLPSLSDFVTATENATTACGVSWSLARMNYPYWSGVTGSSSYDWGLESELHTRWLGYSILKSGRRGLVEFEDRTLMGIHYRVFAFDKGTAEQDFGDFTAFVLTKTAAEKEAFYAAVAANDSLQLASANIVEKYPEFIVERNGVYYDRRWPYYGGQIGADAIKAKVAIVKAWWQQVGITLKEPE
jgi:hypothetical protein